MLVFGRETPNSLVLYLFWAAALAAQFRVLRARGFPARDAVLASLAFVFGTNVYVSCVRANVWAQGQSLGYCLAILGLACVTHNRRRGLAGPTAGYVLLALAVGCRPLYLSMAAPVPRPRPSHVGARAPARRGHRRAGHGALRPRPRLVQLGALRRSRRVRPQLPAVGEEARDRHLRRGLPAAEPVPRVRALAGVDGRLARRSRFDPWGTAFYINQGILLFVLWGLVARRFDPVVKATAAFAMAVIAAGIFTYEAGGWRQFGYRYIIDLDPGRLRGVRASRTSASTGGCSPRSPGRWR